MRYEVRAYIEDRKQCMASLEIDAENEELARKDALARLRAIYPPTASINVVVAKELDAY